MKQLMGLSNNIFYTREKEPMIEVIIMIHEPTWEMIDGQPVKRQGMREVRVFNKFETIKRIFSEFIDETEKELSNENNKIK